MTMGARIKAARRKVGLTQTELAGKLGISFQSIAQWENDLRNPKLETLRKIAGALDIPISQLLSTEQQVGLSALQYFAEDTTEGRSKELHRSFDLLNKENQIKVIDYSDSLLKAEMYDENRKKR